MPASGRSIVNKIPVLVASAGGKHYRGAQIRAIAGAVATVRLHREQHDVIDRTCATALLGAGAQAGSPICVEVSNPSGACTIVAVHGACPADHNLERAWERDGTTFAPGAVPVHLGGNP